ncbi:MAG: hypothetical protein K0R54_1850 [Clostridiaceae bacterium]|jgi:hypothetical protein|nr:hypothetical protein [Clostridiaceae bacterium]
MSYKFSLGFINMKKEEVLDFCLNFTNECTKNSYEFINDCKYDIPSYDMEETDNTKIGFKLDKMWLYQLFNISFIYWEEKEILAVSGTVFPMSAKGMFKTWVSFQNSSDSDYDYNTWNGIDYFENIVNMVMELSSKQLIIKNHTLDEVEADIDYYKKVYVSETIYKELDLDNWLYGKEGKFKRIIINCIDSQEKYFKLLSVLKKVKNENLD